MKLSREGEAPILEHNSEFIFLTEEQFNRLKTLTHRTVRDYLREFVISDLNTESERSVVERWLADDGIWAGFNSNQ